jgi:hypothetical protein
LIRRLTHDYCAGIEGPGGRDPGRVAAYGMMECWSNGRWVRFPIKENRLIAIHKNHAQINSEFY